MRDHADPLTELTTGTDHDPFDVYGALWLFCSRYHSGQSSTGYSVLSRLVTIGYKPGLGLQNGRFESDAQRYIYHWLVKHWRKRV